MSQPSAAQPQPTSQEDWIGNQVRITGYGGAIAVENGKIITTRYGLGSVFTVVPGKGGGVSFRYDGGDDDDSFYYVTAHLYGDAGRRALCEALEEIDPTLILPETLRTIVEFATPKATDLTNYEGPGYSYQPLTLERGGMTTTTSTTNGSSLESSSVSPTVLQTFELEETNTHLRGGNVVGIRTQFGSYWRSEHWNHVVSQAPHCLRDEQWTLRLIVS